MIKCKECKFSIDVNSEAKNRPVIECRVSGPICNDAGGAQWPVIRKTEIGCAEGIQIGSVQEKSKQSKGK